MVEPRLFVLGCFDGWIQPCISLWISGGSYFTTAGSTSSTLNIHVLLPEGSAPPLVLLLSALFTSEELPGPNITTSIQQTERHVSGLIGINIIASV